eukprot:9019342-Pyramimonas_sp.AAC.1
MGEFGRSVSWCPPAGRRARQTKISSLPGGEAGEWPRSSGMSQSPHGAPLGFLRRALGGHCEAVRELRGGFPTVSGEPLGAFLGRLECFVVGASESVQGVLWGTSAWQCEVLLGASGERVGDLKGSFRGL